MKFINEKGKKYILVSEQTDLDELISQFSQQEQFAYLFKFSDRQHFVTLLEILKVDYDNFTTRYYHFDASRKLHISESEFGDVWISTVGLVAKGKMTKNRAVNACLNQNVVISLLLEKAITVIDDEKVYDIDSYNFELLNELSPAIFHNLTFYVEVFCKAYISLTGIQAPHSHKLQLIYQKTVEVMNNNKHNDSLFHVLILDPLKKLVDHLSQIPGDFKEHFIKYDDNPKDDTVILFESAGLNEMKHVLELSVDFILDYYHIGADTHYLQSNLYQRLLDRAGTEEKRARIMHLYPHLAKKD